MTKVDVSYYFNRVLTTKSEKPMKTIFLTIALSMASFASAKDYVKDVVIPVSKKSNITIHSLPSLQSKKVSTLKIESSSKNISIVSFDAEMPEHDHGMIVTPTTPEPTKDGKAVIIKGVKLHMPGNWVLKLNIKENGKERTISHPYSVNP